MNKKVRITILATLLAAGIVALWWYQQPGRNEIQVGTILGLTGQNAAYGQEMNRGFDFAIDEVNSQRGVKGRKLRLLAEDSQFDPAKAVTAYQRLTSIRNIWLIVGITGSNNALAVCAAARNDHAVILDPLGSAPALTSGRSRGYFRIMASDAFAGKYNVDWAIANGMKHPAIIYEEDNWGASYRDAVLRYLAEKGYETVPSEGIIAGTRDFRTQVEKMKSERPDAIFLLTYAGEGAAFMKALREIGLNTPVYGSDNISSNEFTSAGAAAIEGVWVAMPTPAAGLQYDSFVERYKKRYGEIPDANIMKSYDAMMLMAKAIDQYGADPVRIRQYFESPGFSYEGVSGRIRFDSNGDLVGQQYARMVYHASKLNPLQ